MNLLIRIVTRARESMHYLGETFGDALASCQASWQRMRATLKLSSCFYWLFLLIAGAISLYCVFVPSTGLALTGLTIPPLAWGFKERMTERQKVCWAILSVFLVIGVHRGLAKDQNDLSKTATSFTDIKGKLDAAGTKLDSVSSNLNQVSANMSQASQTLSNVAQTEQETLEATISGAKDVVSTETGGNSFCYFVLANNGTIPTIVHQGNYPLYGVEARFVDASRPFTPTVDLLNRSILKVGDLTLQSSEIIAGIVVPFKADGSLDANVFFGARNGFWTELLRGKRVNGQWVEAIRVISPKSNRVLLERVDKQYPRDANGKIDWN